MLVRMYRRAPTQHATCLLVHLNTPYISRVPTPRHAAATLRHFSCTAPLRKQDWIPRQPAWQKRAEERATQRHVEASQLDMAKLMHRREAVASDEQRPRMNREAELDRIDVDMKYLHAMAQRRLAVDAYVRGGLANGSISSMNERSKNPDTVAKEVELAEDAYTATKAALIASLETVLPTVLGPWRDVPISRRVHSLFFVLLAVPWSAILVAVARVGLANARKFQKGDGER